MPASPVVQLRVPGDVLAAVDETRGETSRSAWILAAITSRLSPPAAVLSPRPVTGTGLTADMLPAATASNAQRAPKPKTRRAPAAAKPRAASGGCKHEHVLKGWCRECKTGGH